VFGLSWSKSLAGGDVVEPRTARGRFGVALHMQLHFEMRVDRHRILLLKLSRHYKEISILTICSPTPLLFYL
jgi:hypothetical protein